jgi:hypothetical protein
MGPKLHQWAGVGTAAISKFGSHRGDEHPGHFDFPDPMGENCQHIPSAMTRLDFSSGVPGLVNIQKTMENHHLSWENSLFLWWFSIVILT